MPLSGLRVLDLSDHAGALCARVLADLGAEVVRVEPVAGTDVRKVPPVRDGTSLAHRYVNDGKRIVEIDLRREGPVLQEWIEWSDVVVDARSMAEGWPPDPDLPSRRPERTIWLEITPFGAAGPRATWRGNDFVCAARGGMTYVNGPADEEPVTPFGLAAYAATGLTGAVAVLTALRARDLAGRGARLDLAVTAAVAGALEHVTGLHRQRGVVQRRQGTLHWSRTFRVGAARDGLVLVTHLGDWTTLSEWVASEHADASVLLEPFWKEGANRRAHAEELFDILDGWIRTRSASDVCTGAELRRLPFAEVRAPERLARDAQLRARGVANGSSSGPGSAPPLFALGCADGGAGRALRSTSETRAGATAVDRLRAPGPAARPLDGVLVLDFTWVVAGPVATRILADQGARVVKVEHRDAPDFGTRRGGLTGNLNRGKESVVLDLDREEARSIARDLASKADVVIDNFSARVMQAWGLDHGSLRARRPDAISLRLTGFGLDGPLRDAVSYGPTLQARAGYPHLMVTAKGTPSGWGYSWSDMAAGWSGALAALAALRHRDRTGQGQCVDLSQFENLVGLLGPGVLDLMEGRPVEPPSNRSQEGLRSPHGLFRCRAEGEDDDRWVAISVDRDQAWAALAERLVRDGEEWAASVGLRTAEGRLRREAEVRPRIQGWARRHRAEDLEEELQGLGVPAGLVAHGGDLLADPQLRARGHFACAAAPGETDHEFDGIPYLTDVLPGRIARPGPLCGEHTDSVLSELLGFGSSEIRRLRDEEVLG